MNFYVTKKITDFKTSPYNDKLPFLIVNINHWFKKNNLTPKKMNNVRHYIFEEWIEIKLREYKIMRYGPKQNIVFVYKSFSDTLVNFLKEKLEQELELEKAIPVYL
jgi:hypothetical protein